MDNVMLNNILLVTSTEHCVSITPSNYSLSSTTVRWTRWVYVLCELMSVTIHPYVTVLDFGDFLLGMRKIVLFPFGMRSYTLGWYT